MNRVFNQLDYMFLTPVRADEFSSARGGQEGGLRSLLHLNSVELFLVVRIQVQRRPLTLLRSTFLPFRFNVSLGVKFTYILCAKADFPLYSNRSNL